MDQEPSFSGPVYAIYQGEHSFIFREVANVVFHGLPCLKGIMLRMRKEDWRAGLTHYIPQTSVTQIIEYASPEAFRKIIADHYAQKSDVQP